MAKYKNLIDVGNLNIDNNTLTIDCVNNRVGIGVSDPSAGLEVESDNGIIVSRNGYSQCLQFQPANSGIPTILGLGGSGVHIGPTSATGIRMDSSGNVGVGTTAVAVGYKLTNNGAFFVNAGGGSGITINGAAGGNRILRFHTGDISSNSIRWGLAANATTEGGSDAGSDFGIYRYDDAGTYISEALTIERSTGNVGLNCATPPAALSISAGNRPDQDAVYIVGTPDDGKSILCIRSNHTSGATKNLIHVARSGKEGLFVVNNSEAVGIGTTTPSRKLEISNARTETNFGTNANSMFSLENDDTTVNNFASMQFHDGSGLGSAYIGARFLRTNKGGDLFFGTRNDATGGAYIRMTINDAGLVGIANENPSYTLDVTGNINFTGNLTLNGSVYGGASGFWTSNVNDIYYTAGGIAIGTSAPYAAKVTIVNDTSTAYANVTPSIANFAQVMVNNCDHVSGGTFAGLQFNLTGNSQNRISYIGSITEGSGNRFASLVFGSDDGGTRAEMMRINSDGNIGIGTNNITDHASFSRALVVNGPSGGAIYVKDNDSSTDVGVFGQANTCTYIENLAVGPIRFYTCNGTDFSERMRITSSGTLAVGTEAPASQALLKADFAGDLLLSTGTTSTLYLQDTTNWVQLISGDMRFGLSSAEKMRITSDSRVGIGTTPDADAGLHVDTTSFTGASGGIFMEDARTDANPWIAVKNDVQQWQIQTAGARNDNFEIWDKTGSSTKLAVTTAGNVGIGDNNTQPAYKLDVSGTIYGENLLSRNTYINKSYSSNYNFSLYPELSDGNIRPEVLEYSSANSANVTYGNTNESDAPYAEYFATDGNLTLCGGKIPVCAGESVYGEVWVKRASGATGTAGDLYFGVVREDKDCNPISTNAGIIYFVSAEAIPTDGVWHKYSGNLTLPTSHTPFNGSDGGPVRYIEPHLLVNYSAGTIPTCVSNIVVRKTNINSDCGPTINLGHLSLIENCSNTNQYSTGSYDNIRISNIDQTTDNWAGISFQDGFTEAASAVIQTRFKDHTNNYGELHFSTRGSNGLSSNMVIDQDGCVGIGTDSPSDTTLTVAGNNTSVDLGGNSALSILDGNADNEFVNLKFKTGTGGPLAYIGAKAITTGVYPNSVGQLHFAIQNGSGRFNAMVIDEDQQIGIGTTDPATRLQIDDNGDGHIARFRGTGTNAGQRAIDIGVGNTDVSALETQQSYIYTTATNSADSGLVLAAEGGTAAQSGVLFYTGNVGSLTQRMRIDRDGNVGIGDHDPAYKLHVVNEGLGLRVENTNTSFVGNAWQFLANDAATVDAGASNYALAVFQTARPITSTGNIIRVVNSNIGEVFVVKDSGNVGIGEASPATILHAKSSSGIGKIRLEDDSGRIVELQSPSSGADNGRIGTISNHDFEINAGNGNGTNFITFFTDGSEKVRIDNNGRLGIGQIPDDVQVDTSTIRIGGLLYVTGPKSETGSSNFVTGLHYNAYPDGQATFKAVVNSSTIDYRPSSYVQQYGQHYFKVASSATADTAVAFTDAVTITQSEVKIDKDWNLFTCSCSSNTTNHYIDINLCNTDFSILDVYATANPNDAGSTAYKDPFHFQIYNGTGWSGQLSNFIYAQMISPPPRDNFASGSSLSPADYIEVYWTDGTNVTDSIALTATPQYIRLCFTDGVGVRPYPNLNVIKRI